jgi:hypothetical protein
VERVVYAASPSQDLSSACQQSYSDALISRLRAMPVTFKSVCGSQNYITSVTYNENSITNTYDNVTQRVRNRTKVVVCKSVM